MQIDLLSTYEELGFLSFLLEKYDVTYECYNYALKLNLSIYNKIHNDELKQKLNEYYYFMGKSLFISNKNLEEAQNYFFEVLKMLSHIDNELITNAIVIKMVDSNFLIAEIYKKKNLYDETQEYYLKALDIANKFDNLLQTIECRALIGNIYNNLGNVSIIENDLISAHIYYNRSLEIRKKLIDEVNILGTYIDLSLTYCNLGFLCSLRNIMEKSSLYISKSLEIIDNYLKNNNISCDDVSSITNSFCIMGDLCESINNLPSAKEYYLKAIDIFEDFINENNSLILRQCLSILYDRVGNIYKLQNDSLMSTEYYRKGLLIR